MTFLTIENDIFFLKVFLKILYRVSITQWNVLDSSLHGFDCGTQEVIVLIETG